MKVGFRVLVLSATVALCSCAPAPPATVDAAAEAFLLQAAAGDFQSHVAPKGVRFRAVHVGRTASTDGEGLPLMCGQFSAAPGQAGTPFATIQTSDYENWLGESGHCQPGSATLDSRRDLSEALTRRYQALSE